MTARIYNKHDNNVAEPCGAAWCSGYRIWLLNLRLIIGREFKPRQDHLLIS